jgi:hypothetical protein
MFRLLLTAASIAAASFALIANGSRAAQPDTPILSDVYGSVTARSITVTEKNGTTRIKVLAPSTYRFHVKDSSKGQNFHLVGPGVNLRTSRAAVTKTTWRVTLSQGTYVYSSDRNSKLRGSFKVRKIPPM